MGWPHLKEATSQSSRRKKREITRDPVVLSWHQILLDRVREHAYGRRDFEHFNIQAHERGISKDELEQLRDHGRPIAIEIGNDSPVDERMPKYHLSLKQSDGREIVGVFLTDGLGLYGVTCWVNQSCP